MTRVLHLLPSFVPAGIETRAVTLMNALGAAYEHRIVPFDGQSSAAEGIFGAVSFEILPPPPAKGTARVLAWTRALVQKERPDLVLTYNWGTFDAVLALRLLRVRRHVHHEDGFNQDEASGQLRRRALARRIVLPHAPLLVVPSQALKELARSSWKVSEARLRCIPNGVDTERFRPPSVEARMKVRAALGTPLERRVVLAVAGLRPVKRLDRLLAALPEVLRRVADCELWIVGDGPLRTALQEQASRQSLPVRFLGFRHDLPDLYGAADLFCLCSDSEQAPVSLLEAMACGLPAVCTAVGDCALNLGPLAKGALVPLAGNSEQALAAALARQLSSGAELLARGRESRERAVQHYSLAGMVSAHEAVWRAALSS